MEEKKAMEAQNASGTEAKAEEKKGAENAKEPDYKALFEAKNAEYESLKQSFDKSASETAEYKRKLADHLTAEERAKMEREQADKELREELETLRNERRVSNYTAKLVSTGIPADDAKGLAAALPEGIPDQFFDGIKNLIADLSAKIKAELLNNQPKLSSGMPMTSGDQKAAEDDLLRKAFRIK